MLLADFLGTELPFMTLRGIYGFITSIEQGRAQFIVAARRVSSRPRRA
ncbi:MULTISPECIES: hypothetical protein [unclassified Modestobacter]|nr:MULTISPECIES: hypothetical protein [unclassified Modestobacter]MCZ2825874.1 hypothetical protein [Modestobacter sp. VKM Ac-2981]MCZ2853061.1 hypothetical protein [Modestobacter sp. VKM Ac-2982]